MSTYEKDSEIPVDKLPYSAEAEQALLGALLIDNKVFYEASQVVAPKNFFNPVHVTIADHIWILCGRRQLADAVVLKNRLAQNEQLNEIGGIEYLALLLQAAPPSATAVEYAKVVAENSHRREMARMGEIVTNSALEVDAKETAYEMYDGLKKQLDGMRALFPTNAVFTEIGDAALIEINDLGKATGNGISTGIEEVDNTTGGFHRGDLWVIGGRPRMGKTSLVSNWMSSVAEAQISLDDEGAHMRPTNQLFFSLEMSVGQLSVRNLSRWMKLKHNMDIEYQDIMNNSNIDVDQRDLLLEEAPKMGKMWRIHVDHSKNLTATEMISRGRAFANKYGPLDIVACDYSQRMSYADTAGRNEHAGMSESLARLADYAGEDALSFLLLSQLTREVDRRDGHRPVISDLRGSGGYEEHATIIAFLKREIVYLTEKGMPKTGGREAQMEYVSQCQEWENRAELIIAKNKRGPEKTITLGAAVKYDMFYDLSKADAIDTGFGI